METTLEPESRTNHPVSLNPESHLSIRNVRQFALNQMDARLAAEPALVASCWAQIGALAALTSAQLSRRLESPVSEKLARLWKPAGHALVK